MTRPEESYRLCCVVVCDLETSRMGAPIYIYDISRLRVNKPPHDGFNMILNEELVAYFKILWCLNGDTQKSVEHSYNKTNEMH